MASHSSRHASLDVDARRRKKTAKERRQQRMRSDTRLMERILTGLCSVDQHRGNSLTKVGKALKRIISDGPSELVTTNEQIKVLNEKNGLQTDSFTPAHNESAPLCSYFVKGICRYGKYCAFSHDENGEKQTSGYTAQSFGDEHEYRPWECDWGGIPASSSSLMFAGAGAASAQQSPFALPTNIEAPATKPDANLLDKLDQLGQQLQQWRNEESIGNALVEDQLRTLASDVGKSELVLTTILDTRIGEVRDSIAGEVATVNHTISQLLSANGVASERNASDMKSYCEDQAHRFRALEAQLQAQHIHLQQFEALVSNTIRLNDDKRDAANNDVSEKLAKLDNRLNLLDEQQAIFGGTLDQIYFCTNATSDLVKNLETTIGNTPNISTAPVGPSPMSGSGHQSAMSSASSVTPSDTQPTEQRYHVTKADLDFLTAEDKALVSRMLKQFPDKREEVYNVAREHITELKGLKDIGGGTPLFELELKYDCFINRQR